MLDMVTEARPGSLDNIQNSSVVLRYLAPHGHTLDDVMRADYWKNLTRECGQQRIPGRHAWNRIEVIAEDGTWEAELRVLAIRENHGVDVRLLREWRQPEKPAAKKGKASADYKVEMVPGNGWRALDAKGGVIAEKLLTEDEAHKAASVRSKGDD